MSSRLREPQDHTAIAFVLAAKRPKPIDDRLIKPDFDPSVRALGHRGVIEPCVLVRERTAASDHRLRDNLRLHLSDRTEGRGLGVIRRGATNAVVHLAPDPRATPSRMIHERPNCARPPGRNQSLA